MPVAASTVVGEARGRARRRRREKSRSTWSGAHPAEGSVGLGTRSGSRGAHDGDRQVRARECRRGSTSAAPIRRARPTSTARCSGGRRPRARRDRRVPRGDGRRPRRRRHRRAAEPGTAGVGHLHRGRRRRRGRRQGRSPPAVRCSCPRWTCSTSGAWRCSPIPVGAVVLGVAGRHASRARELVNEPGTWSWSELLTTDVEASKAFYGDVFGWTADPHGDGPMGEYTEWQVERPVGRRDDAEAADDAGRGAAATGRCTSPWPTPTPRPPHVAELGGIGAHAARRTSSPAASPSSPTPSAPSST